MNVLALNDLTDAPKDKTNPGTRNPSASSTFQQGWENRLPRTPSLEGGLHFLIKAQELRQSWWRRQRSTHLTSSEEDLEITRELWQALQVMVVDEDEDEDGCINSLCAAQAEEQCGGIKTERAGVRWCRLYHGAVYWHVRLVWDGRSCVSSVFLPILT